MHVTNLMKEHRVCAEDFTCPAGGCSASLDIPVVKSVLSSEDHMKLLDLKLRKEYAAADDNARVCPRCDYIVVVEDTEQNQDLLDKLQCQNPECGHKFCGRCGLKPHRNQKDLDLPCREYAAFVEANEQSHHLFEKYLQENKMKRCPKCLLPAELKSGCHFIRCVCKCRYCYLCGRQLGSICTIVTIKRDRMERNAMGVGRIKKGFYAEPRCNRCRGPNCKRCSKSIAESRLAKLSKMSDSNSNEMKRGGFFSWLQRRFGRRRRK